jgi:hypothetical protein
MERTLSYTTPTAFAPWGLLFQHRPHPPTYFGASYPAHASAGIPSPRAKDGPLRGRHPHAWPTLARRPNADLTLASGLRPARASLLPCVLRTLFGHRASRRSLRGLRPCLRASPCASFALALRASLLPPGFALRELRSCLACFARSSVTALRAPCAGFALASGLRPARASRSCLASHGSKLPSSCFRWYSFAKGVGWPTYLHMRVLGTK